MAEMESFESWNPWEKHVQGGLKDFNYLTGRNTLICVGPPYLNSVLNGIQSGLAVLYPVGLLQTFAISQNAAVQQLHEIGSEKAYFFRGRTVRQVSLGRLMYHGPSLLRVLYSWYSSSSGVYTSTAIMNPFSGGNIPEYLRPYATSSDTGASQMTGSTTLITEGLPTIHIPPGYENVWINLASDVFRMPTGFFLLLRDNEDNNVAGVYLEQCHVPTHMMSADSQGTILQETVSAICGGIVPINIDAVTLMTGTPPQTEYVANQVVSL